MIDLLFKLVDKAFQLFKEREARKKSFFDNVISEQHKVFEQLYTQHIETFKETQLMLLDQASSAEEIRSYFESRVLFEGGTIELLNKLVNRIDQGDPVEKSDPDEYDEYLSLIASCLLTPIEPLEPMDDEYLKTSVSYYKSMDTLIDKLCQDENKKIALEGLENIVIRFNKFYAEVQSAYFSLRRLYIN